MQPQARPMARKAFAATTDEEASVTVQKAELQVRIYGREGLKCGPWAKQIRDDNNHGDGQQLRQ